MEITRHILQGLDEHCRTLHLDSTGDIRWTDGQVIRNCAILAQRGDPSGWRDFLAHVDIKKNRDMTAGFIRIFREFGWASYSVEEDCLELTLPANMGPIDEPTRRELVSFLNQDPEIKDEAPTRKELGKIMYIEEKPGLAGHARIGRVRFSASRKTLYYKGRNCNR